jgi:hypothetical protein
MKKIAILIPLIIILSGCGLTQYPQPINNNSSSFDVSHLNSDIERQIALDHAQKIYDQAKANGLDMSKGPCLSNDLYGNIKVPETMWVLDIAHDPRQPVDDLPENQCSAYREGKAKHFIEMNPLGEVITVK